MGFVRALCRRDGPGNLKRQRGKMQLLIYETAVPVSSVQHATASVEVGSDYRFSKNVNSVPLMAVEFPMAAAEYAIVFAGSGGVPMPAVILGMRRWENLFLAD